MSVDQIPTRQPPRKDDSKLVRYEDYIESKIQSTRWMVKAVDLATALVTLVASVLAYLLVVAIVEHWIMPGGFNVAERTTLFVVLVVGAGYFAYHRVWPLLVRAINPVYAARAIEHGSPSLKNSLINLLFFREQRAGISDAVYRTLEEQAAQRLTRVPVETSVDRSLLIHLGYVLIGVVAVAGLYKIFSPKDPIVSAERVLLPWADIVPASRVTIGAVTPGSLTVSRGEFVDVSAEVHGLGDDDPIVLRYTTADGQVVGKAIPMKPAGDGLRYACRVADEADGSDPVGLTRSLKYRLEAGDARSLDYAITVVSAPSILVEHVDYHYPAYTGYVDRTVDGLGDIRAIEGTRMTIHARANGVIRVADVDFDADGRPDLRMTAKENAADASFELGLRGDRQTPLHASYVLRFTNDEGRVNRDPVKHSIAVERDYDPEAAVLLPKEKAIDARLDETVFIEVEARDPDFALSMVRLHGEAAGQSVLDESLLKAEHRGRFTARYSFVANAHGLKAGDEVQYWVEADDNRTPKPNMVVTEKRTIRIVSPGPAQQPPPDRVARNDRQPPKPGEQQGGQQEQGGQQGGKNQGEQKQGGAADQKDQNNQQQGGDAGSQKQPGQSQGDQKGEKQQGGGQGGKSGEQNSGNQQQQSKGDSKSGGEGQASNSQSGEHKDNEQKPGEQGQGGSQSKSKDGSSDASHDQQQSKGEQTGAGASGGEKSKDNAQPDGARPDQGDKSQQPNGNQQQGNQKNGGQQNGAKQPQSGDQKPAVSSEGDNDGEAFERMQKHMEQNGELKKDEKSSNDAGQSAEQKQEGAKKDGEKGKEGEGQQSQQNASKDKADGESKSGESKSKDGESASADGKSAAKPGDANQKQQSDQKGKDQNQSAGAKPNGDDAQQKKEQQSSDGKEQSKSPEGQETGSKGPAGAGEEKQPQGSPNSQPDKKPVEKHQQSGSKEGTNKQEPAAGANSKKESDSSGEQGGDKAGGGEEGAGQKSPHDGTGSAGQNQSADNGAGQSTEKGKGDTSSSGGKDAKSDHPTGSSDGKTPGKGSQQKDGTGNKPGGSAGSESAESPDGKNAAGDKGDKAGSREGEAKGTDSKSGEEGKQAGKQQEKDGQEVGKQGDEKGGEPGKKKEEGSEQGKSSGPTEGGGKPGGAANPQSTIKGTAPEGDAANLDYARKRTDLVLEKLSDQLNKNKVDDRMLKELGWTRDDLRRFVDRWQQRKDAAQRDDAKGEAAKRELDDALRSLGLQRDKLQQNAVEKDSMRDLKQGYRGAVPLEYQERLRAYNQGVSRAARDGE
jgi:hypothetical protein